jgi:foldase protein PrsA
MDFLVQRAQFELKAKELKLDITTKQIDDKLKQIKKQYFGGSEQKYQEGLKKQALTDKGVRVDIRAQLVSEALFKKVTSAVKVTDADIANYYTTNKSVYATKDKRDVRHILVKTKAQADKLYAQLKAGGDFAALAKKYSLDPGSKAQGGKLTISRGDTVKEFDTVAFTLKVNEISKPVKTQFGYHIIQALTPITKGTVTPLSKVKQAIRQQLLQQRQSVAMQKWVEGVKAEFAPKTTYAVGYAPPATISTGSTGTTSTHR